jgi:hypothetical protein
MPPMAEGYYEADIDNAIREIRAAVPDVIIDNHFDYGWRLVVNRPGRKERMIVFQPGIEYGHQEEIITPVADVISWLKSS